MSICREWTLVKDGALKKAAKPLLCRSWSCEHCRPLRRNQLMALAASGDATRFVTVTVNPRSYSSPEERCRKLAWAWRTFIMQLRRRYPKDTFEYLAVVEETKQGEPHLHILMRSRYVPHALISKAMRLLIDAPVVHIRKVTSQRNAIGYVAKYITKAPKQFGNAKRYWNSQHYELDRPIPLSKVNPFLKTWQVDRRHILQIIDQWHHEGYACRADGSDTIVAVYVGYERRL